MGWVLTTLTVPYHLNPDRPALCFAFYYHARAEQNRMLAFDFYLGMLKVMDRSQRITCVVLHIQVLDFLQQLWSHVTWHLIALSWFPKEFFESWSRSSVRNCLIPHWLIRTLQSLFGWLPISFHCIPCQEDSCRSWTCLAPAPSQSTCYCCPRRKYCFLNMLRLNHTLRGESSEFRMLLSD